MLFLLLILAFPDIHNGEKPGDPIELKLSREFIIGNEASDVVLASRIRVAINDNGDIYVLEPGNQRVLMLNHKGELIRNFGRKGQGPGEFQEPKEIVVGPKGVYVFDLRTKKMSVFDFNGKFIEGVFFPNHIVQIWRPIFFENGNMAFFSVLFDSNRDTIYDFSLYDSEFKSIKNFVHMPLPKADWGRSGSPDFWVGYLKDIFEGYLRGYPMHAKLDDKTFVYAVSTRYKGAVVDQNGKVLGRFDKKLKPKMFTETAIRATFHGYWDLLCVNPSLATNMTKSVFEKALNKTEVPPVLMPLWSVITLGDKFAFLANYDASARSGLLELFSRDGVYLGTVEIKAYSEDLYGAGNLVYSVGVDEKDNIVLACYRVEGL